MKFFSDHRSLLLLLVFPALLLSCKKDKPKPASPVIVEDQLSITVQPEFGNTAFYLDSTYMTDDGVAIQFTDIKFFAGDWKNGSKSLIDAALFDYRQNGTAFISVKKSPDDFQALQGYLGIGAAANHSDPTAYPNEHPLNITNAGGMHWGWNPGYIFIKVEARADTIPDGIPLFDHNIVLHVGTDAFLRTLDFPAVNWTKLAEHSWKAGMKLDMQRFLSNGTQVIHLKTEYTSHSAPGQEAVSIKAIENFAAALSFIP